MSDLNRCIDTLTQLVAFPSVSSESNDGVSDWVRGHLESLGFRTEVTHYTDANGVPKSNVIGRRDPVGGGPTDSPGIAYFCHTDVVPPGDWTGPGGHPFEVVIEGERLYGRGSCDMKGSLAAMLTAAESISVDEQRSTLWIVCTADEEVGFVGARQLVANSPAYAELADQQPLAIIGEPTSLRVVHAHKGIRGFRFTSHGRAAHSSTRHGINANVAMLPMLELIGELGRTTEEDSKYHDPRFDPPTLTWNFGVSDGAKAINVTPEKSSAWVSFRPMPEINGDDLVEQLRDRARSLGLEFEKLEGGQPLWVEPDADCVERLCKLTGETPTTVCYGTDGGEFTSLQQRVVWGPGSIDQAHTTDEWIELEQLRRGIDLYARTLREG